MTHKNKSLLKRNLTPKQIVGFGSLFFILAVIPVTLVAVGNPVSFFSEASYTNRACNQPCSSQGYTKGGYLFNRFRPCGAYTKKVDNCCCSTAPDRNERFSCAAPCQSAGYDGGMVESKAIACSQRAPTLETAVIGNCCCSRDPLPDLQVTNISWSQDIKSTWTTELPGTQNIFVRAAVLNKSNFYKTDASKSGLTFNRSSVAENVGLFLWFNGGRMFQPKPTITTSSTNHFTPNQSHSFDFIYHIKYRPWCSWGGATAKFKVCADPENKIEESDETNNCLEKELLCDIFNY